MENGIKMENNGKDPLTGQFVEGHPGGPGRPKGRRNYASIYYEALNDVGAENNISADDLENLLVKVAIKKAREGDYQFYRDTMDRIHGKPIQPTDITSKGDKINTYIIKDGTDNLSPTQEPVGDNQEQTQV